MKKGLSRVFSKVYAGDRLKDSQVIHDLIDALDDRDGSLVDVMPELTAIEGAQLCIVYGTATSRFGLILMALENLRDRWHVEKTHLESAFWLKVKTDWHAQFIEDESE